MLYLVDIFICYVALTLCGEHPILEQIHPAHYQGRNGLGWGEFILLGDTRQAVLGVGRLRHIYTVDGLEWSASPSDFPPATCSTEEKA